MAQLPLAFHPPNPSVSLRPVRLADADGLFTACWPTRPFATIYNLVQRATQSALEERGIGLVALGNDNTVQGYGQMLLWPSVAEISDMVVADEFRGRGYGTAIIQALVRASIKLGAQEAEIGASLNNPRAAALYRRLGFQDSHTVALNFGDRNEQILYLRLNLQNVRLSAHRQTQTQ